MDIEYNESVVKTRKVIVGNYEKSKRSEQNGHGHKELDEKLRREATQSQQNQ